MRKTLFLTCALLTASVSPLLAESPAAAVQEATATPSYTEAQEKAIARYAFEVLVRSFDDTNKAGINMLDETDKDPAHIVKKLEIDNEIFKSVSTEGLPENVIAYFKARNEKLQGILKDVKNLEKDGKLVEVFEEYSKSDQDNASKLGLEAILAEQMKEVIDSAAVMKWMVDYQTKHPELQTKDPKQAQAEITKGLFTDVIIPSIKAYLAEKN